METLNILLIVDVRAEAEHSAVEGLFKFESNDGVACTKIFFSKSIRKPLCLSDRLVLPHRHRRYNLWQTLSKHVDIDRYHIIIIRNLFPVLQQIQAQQPKARIGFWESFSHSHRRLEQAYLEKRAIWRKRMEYYFAERKERRLLRKCDFYLPISQTHKDVFYPDLQIPYMATPMGFDFRQYPVGAPTEKSGPIRFVYIGSIDKLRSMDIVKRAFLAQQYDYILDIYSDSQNEAADTFRSIHDQRIRFHPGLPRDALLRDIRTADIGVCFVPHTKTYIGASPTKTVEYGALGLSVLVNPLPDYKELLDDGCAFICDFDEESIKKEIDGIIHLNRLFILERGRQLQKRVKAQRDYRLLSKRLAGFLRERLLSSGRTI